MTLEDWHLSRTLALALMAATLEAGDRARTATIQDKPSLYANRAIALFDAVEQATEGK